MTIEFWCSESRRYCWTMSGKIKKISRKRGNFINDLTPLYTTTVHTAHRSAGAKCWSKMIRADLGTCDKELFHETWPWRLTMNFSCWQDKGQLCDINPCQLSTYSQLPAYFPVKLFFVKKWRCKTENSGHFSFFGINLCVIKNFPFSTFVDFGRSKIISC